MAPARDEAALRALLRRIDGRGYKAYQDLRGAWELPPFALFVDHVQGDPFAAPSRVRVRIARAEAAWPDALASGRVRRVAFEDHLARRVRDAARRAQARRGSGKSGLLAIDAGGQEVLERTALRVGDAFLEARLDVGLPAAGRRILGGEAEALLLDDLPRAARDALRPREGDVAEAWRFVATAENHAALQARLASHGLVAFVADGAVLPRESGASDRPLPEGAVAFRAPEGLRVELEVPHAVDEAGTPCAGPDEKGAPPGRVAGLGIPAGVTLVVGGGYHGKSTLLRALERGVHPHVPGDGRERVATLPGAVKIRAEDGRRVAGCDISAFVGDLPQGRSTRTFWSDDASGSTSQAANIVEALEAGATALLLDEDTSATNFMVRDARMQALVARDHEPITPFVDRVRELHESLGVSTVLVMGGSGDYFDVADTVIEMLAFEPRDVTAEARRVAAALPTGRRRDARSGLVRPPPRVPDPSSLDPSRGRRPVKVDARGRDALAFGVHTVDLRAVEQIVDPSQVRAIGYALALAKERLLRDGTSLPELLDALDALLDAEGLDALSRRANLARPRRFEIAAALSRLRTLRVAAG